MFDVDRMSEAIDRGVDLLNEHTPHWFKLIDLKRLELSVCADCIIGQVFGTDDFTEAFEAFAPEGTEPYMYGFDTDDGEDYTELTDVWTGKIEELIDIADDARWTPTL